MASRKNVFVFIICVNSLLVWKSATSSNIEDLERDYYRSDTDSLDVPAHDDTEIVIVKRQISAEEEESDQNCLNVSSIGSFALKNKSSDEHSDNHSTDKNDSTKNRAKPGLLDAVGKAINKTAPHKVANATITRVVTKVQNESSSVADIVTAAPNPSSRIPGNSSEEEELLEQLSKDICTEKHNITKLTEDHHRYYNSSFFTDPIVGEQYWVEIESMGNTVTHDMLSKSHRRAATVNLSFEFPFYGHVIKNVTIATGGFLYTGEYVHSWLAATQYIAPLMANFDTSLSSDSTIKYVDNGTAFTVQWSKVALQNEVSVNQFTFQATLHRNGDIVFAYHDVPIIVTSIEDQSHPVKVGLSDAYIIDRTIFFVRRKTIYEYHRVNMKKEEIGNHTAIYFTALTTCISLTDCAMCLSAKISFNCTWCHTANRCSDSMDRRRQDWLLKGCDKISVQDLGSCGPLFRETVPPTEGAVGSGNQQPLSNVTSEPSMHPHGSTVHFNPDKDVTEPSDGGNKNWPKYNPVTDSHEVGDTNSSSPSPSESSVTQAVSAQPHKEIISHVEDSGHVSSGTGGIIGIFLLAVLFLGLVVWFGYAYKHPHTSSGQFLIKYRPSQWRLRRGEAHYTPASIHM